MGMEKLTNSIDYCKLHCDFGKEEKCFFQDKSKCYEKNIYEKLREYEDAEEQKLLIKLPCKVGDTVYCIKAKWKDRMGNSGTECYVSEETAYHLNWIVENLNKFGKTVFLTKEAAEQAFAEKGV